ncbi:MAG: glutathione S-transferase [Comamonadaceae bacterium]|nr:MAG: glutathione S-transferase [Comamonadaceae bacterium]
MPGLTAASILALLAVLLTALSLHISRLRLRYRVSFGDGGHKDLLVAVRAHGNALEQSLLFGLLLLAAEASAALAPTWLAGAGIAFIAVRIVHAAAMFGRRLGWRQAAHVVSVLLQGLLAVAILVK